MMNDRRGGNPHTIIGWSAMDFAKGDFNADLMNDADFLQTSAVRIPHPFAPKVSG